MALDLPFGVGSTNPVPVQKTYGPYGSLAEARGAVPQAIRYDGLTVMISDQGEYWWRAADLSDNGLVAKTTGGTGGDPSLPPRVTALENIVQQPVLVYDSTTDPPYQGFADLDTALASYAEAVVEIRADVELTAPRGLTNSLRLIGEQQLVRLSADLSTYDFYCRNLFLRGVSPNALLSFFGGVMEGGALQELPTVISQSTFTLRNTLVVWTKSGYWLTKNTINEATLVLEGSSADTVQDSWVQPGITIVRKAGAGATFDPFAVDGLVAAVVGGTYATEGPTIGELQGEQPAGSMPNMSFKKGQAKYQYMRGDVGTLVWVRSPAG